MRFRSLGKTTPLYALIIAACVGLFSFSVSADNMISADQLARQQLIDSASALSGVTNSGVSDILGVDVVSVTHDLGELSSLSGTTDTGSTNSGSTGVIVTTPPIDYSTYSYYDGLFVHDGKTYGNSLYPDTLGFNKKIDGVTIYSYDEYLSRQGSVVTADLSKKNQKSSTSTKNQKIGNTMISSNMTALAAPTNGLIAEYLLDGNVNDTSGNNIYTVPTNVNWITDKFGITNHAARFINSNITTGIYSILNPSYISISFWEKGLSTNGISTGSSIYIGMSELYSIRVINNTPIFYIAKNSGCNSFSGYYSVSSSINVNSSNWNHIAGTFDGTTLRIFVNGVESGITTIQSPISINYCSNKSLDIFVTNFLDGSSTTADLDNLRLYNRALSLSEIQDLYNEPPTGSVSNDTNVPYLNNYFISNPTATSSPFDNFATKSNPVVIKKDAEPGKDTKDNTNLGDPVNLATGEFGYENTLMNIPGIGLPYQLGISYKNQTSYNGPLGFNWDHNYNQYLSGETNGNVLYYNGKLGTFRFIKNGSNFVRNEGLRANLVLSGGLYMINYDNGTRSSFNALNRISSYTDQNNNTLNFNYSGQYLSSVVDTLGRTINYSYYDHNRLQTVTDFTGRRVDFVYYTGATASGNLYDLKDIILTNSGTTKKISFEYSTGSSEPQIHNITRLIDAKGQIYVENAYDTGDRVATQRYGDGTLTYTYTLSGGLITQNTVVDKVGNRSDYTYDATGNNTSTRYYNPAQTGSVLYGYTYNTGGLVLTETRPRGNEYRYSYDTNGNLTSKRLKSNMSLADSAADIVTSYAYNTRNEKISETLPNGVIINYGRDANGNMTAQGYAGVVVNPSNPGLSMTGTYTYYPNGLLKSILSAAGRPIQYIYSSGQLTTLVRGTGFYDTSTGSFTYSPYGTALAATDGDGYIKRYEYSPFDLMTKSTTASGIITTYDYDANHNKIRETRFLSGGLGVNSYFYYDSLDHLTGSLVDITPGQTLLTTYKYDANGNVIEKKIGNGSLTKYKYNEFSKVIEERIIMVPGDSTKDIVTTYTYDTNNNLVSKIDPRGYMTTYIYDLYDRLTQETNPQGTYTTYTYLKDNSMNTKKIYTNTGLMLTSLAWQYDNMGHKTQETSYLDPVNSTGAIVKNWTYTQDFEVFFEKESQKQYKTYFYTTRGELKMTVYPLSNNTQIAYNKRGIKIQDAISDNDARWTPTDYLIDADGRTIRSTNALGKYKTYTYDNLNNIIRTVDEVGRVTDITRDYRGLMLTSTSYSGSTTITTTYTYDDRGNMTSIVDPMGRTTSYQYDGINRNTKIVYPDLKEMIYTYDKNSNLLTKTDPNGTVVTNAYNSLNQLTNRSISLGAGVGGVTSEIYNYDPLGRLISAGDNTNPTGTGAPTYSGAATINLTFTYDALSRLKSETQKSLGGTPYTVGYNYSNTWYSLSGSVVTYLSIGDLTSITLPDGKIQTITYDLLHRPLVITYSGQIIATNTYTGFLQNRSTYGNSKITDYTYDTINRVNSINHGSGILSPSYTYNDASDVLTDGTKSYAYDPLARLISATPVPAMSGTLVESYSYDKTGNRGTGTIFMNNNTVSYTTNNIDQYTRFQGQTTSANLTYDNNGNLNKLLYTHTYDYNNRLIQANSGINILTRYTYDVLGRRTQLIYRPTTDYPELTTYIYTGDNIISESKTILVPPVGLVKPFTPMTLKKNYINGIGTDSLIAYDAEEQVGGTYGTGKTLSRYYYHFNQLGSVIALTSSTGSVVTRYTYDSFGLPYIITGNGTGTTITRYSYVSGNKNSNSRLFTGREYDIGTNLYYNRARYYDSEYTGRFLSRDPIGQNDQVNLYTYVANSPLKYVDRMGKSAKAIIQIFRDAQSDMGDYRSKYEVSGYSNDWNININTFYFNREFAGTLLPGISGDGRYDLAYGGKDKEKNYGIKKNYDKDNDGNVLFAGQEINLGEISNVLTALNASRLGLSQDHLESMAMKTVELNAGNGVQGELADRKLYSYGYALGLVEEKNTSLTDAQIINAVKSAVQSRKAYINALNQ